MPAIFDEICYFWTCASVDIIRPLPGAWVAELLGIIIFKFRVFDNERAKTIPNHFWHLLFH